MRFEKQIGINKLEQEIFQWLDLKGKVINGTEYTIETCRLNIPEEVIVYFKNVHYYNKSGELTCIE